MRRLPLVLLAAPLALVACGGSSSSSQSKLEPVSYVRHAARVTASTPSEHVTTSVTLGVGPVNVSLAGAGDYSNTAHTGVFAMRMSLLGKNTKVNEIEDGTTIYVSSPLFAKSLPAGKTWLKLELASLGKSSGIDFASLLDRSPTQALQQLQAAGTLTRVGAGTIDGAATTHYRVQNLDVSKLPQGAKLESFGRYTYGPIDVWIGNTSGYVYRETLPFTFSSSGQSGSASIHADFSKFGEKVHVTVPPASETVNASTLPGLGGR
ncbi:MAG TPA: hypothetical protein VKO84_11480 [Gaiellaceae bacterium]|nr:hypothetical protein [Gaiellaceae bacterium]